MSVASTHPFIDFNPRLDALHPSDWALLGEVRSKIEHLAGAPLPPRLAAEMTAVELARGVHATTAIEGNTLTLAQVRAQVEGRGNLPPSQAYLGREVDNIVGLLNGVAARVLERRWTLTVPWLLETHAALLDDLPHQEHVTPGRLRAHVVAVNRYRAPEADAVPALLDTFVDWARRPLPVENIGPVCDGVLRAVLAHLYFAWIHPFGDGNGRTARLIEFAVLLDAGVPDVAAHVLSNHYNLTRDHYYLHLDIARRGPGGVAAFVRYALVGLVDGLRERIGRVRLEQRRLVWRELAHEREDAGGAAVRTRRRDLLLALGAFDAPATPEVIVQTDAALFRAYASRSARTLARDLAQLEAESFVERTDGRWRARLEIVEALLPRAVG